MTTAKTGLDPDDYLQVWKMTEAGAFAFFGLDPSKHEIVILKSKPETAREMTRYKPTAKLFGIRALPAVPGVHTDKAAVK